MKQPQITITPQRKELKQSLDSKPKNICVFRVLKILLLKALQRKKMMLKSLVLELLERITC